MRKNPGRRARRDDARKAGHAPRAFYGQGLLQPQRMRNKERMAKIHPLRDENGAYTRTGRGFCFGGAYYPHDSSGRRIWLAGISAQRGF